MTYTDHKYLLRECMVNSFPGRTLEVHFYEKQPKEISQHKKIDYHVAIERNIQSQLSWYMCSPDLCRYMYIISMHWCLLLLRLDKGSVPYFGEGTVLAMTVF